MSVDDENPIEFHPYENGYGKGIYLTPDSRLFIVGTFPIGKFTNPLRKDEIKPNEIDFFYGGATNRHWVAMADLFNKELKSRANIETFLCENKISVADVIQSCRRINGEASDDKLYEMIWNPNLDKILKEHPSTKIIFTSDIAAEWFNANIYKDYPSQMVILISPSAQGARRIGRMNEYKALKARTPNYNTLEFLKLKYREAFNQLDLWPQKV